MSSTTVEFKNKEYVLDLDNKTVWLTVQEIADFYKVTADNISKHVRNIYEDRELASESTYKPSRMVDSLGREREVKTYNQIIVKAIGHRIRKNKHKNDKRFIYLILNPLNKCIKIGITKDVDKRISSLSTQSGIGLELIYEKEVERAKDVEGYLHERYRKYRTLGEWFSINEHHVVKIKAYLTKRSEQ